MDSSKQEQFEALGALEEFNRRLLRDLPTVIDELSGNRRPDTDEFLMKLINSINWEISVTNSTSDMLNDSQARIDKEGFNQKATELNAALSGGVDSEIAAALQGLLPYFQQLADAVKGVVG